MRWYHIRCDDDMVQLKAVISESRSRDVGEYMCLRLKRQEGDILGFVSRESESMTSYGRAFKMQVCRRKCVLGL